MPVTRHITEKRRTPAILAHNHYFDLDSLYSYLQQMHTIVYTLYIHTIIFYKYKSLSLSLQFLPTLSTTPLWLALLDVRYNSHSSLSSSSFTVLCSQFSFADLSVSRHLRRPPLAAHSLLRWCLFLCSITAGTVPRRSPTAHTQFVDKYLSLTTTSVHMFTVYFHHLFSVPSDWIRPSNLQCLTFSKRKALRSFYIMLRQSLSWRH